MANVYYPPAGFYFAVEIKGISSSPMGFQAAEGLEVKMNVDKITEGGENRFVYRVPGRIEYENLKLKRGLKVGSGNSAPLVQWCRDTLFSDLGEKIKTQNIIVKLLETRTQKGDNVGFSGSSPGDPIAEWTFEAAYPISWRVDNLDSEKGDSVLIEEVEFVYKRMERTK